MDHFPKFRLATTRDVEAEAVELVNFLRKHFDKRSQKRKRARKRMIFERIGTEEIFKKSCASTSSEN